MRFRIDSYDQDVGAILDEPVDEETIRAYGDEQFAHEAVAALLGLWAECTIQVVEGWVVTPEHPDEIDRLVAIAREGRAQGESSAAMASAGRFDRADCGQSESPQNSKT